MDPTPTPRSRLFIVLMVVLAIGVVFDAYSSVRLSGKLDQMIAAQVAMRRFPCERIPTELIQEEPICVQKLLNWMNITNFRVVTNASLLSGLDPDTKKRPGEPERFNGEQNQPR